MSGSEKVHCLVLASPEKDLMWQVRRQISLVKYRSNLPCGVIGNTLAMNQIKDRFMATLN